MPCSTQLSSLHDVLGTMVDAVVKIELVLLVAWLHFLRLPAIFTKTFA